MKGNEEYDGNEVTFRGVQCTSVCGIFDQIVASTGVSMKYIQRFKPELLPNIVEIYVHPGHHVDFYPNSSKVHLKLIKRYEYVVMPTYRYFTPQSKKLLNDQIFHGLPLTKRY